MANVGHLNTPLDNPFARRVAQIPEIRDMICEFVNTDEAELARTTLARLACASQEFFYSAVRLLWADHTDFTPLLMLLPEVPCVSDATPEVFPGAESYFARFNIYAPSVKTLALNAQTPLTRPLHLEKIRSYSQSHTLLPNLISLSVRNHCFPAQDISALLEWLEVLVPPSLRRLYLRGLSDRREVLPHKPNFYTLASSTAHKCAHLHRLSIRLDSGFRHNQPDSVQLLYTSTPTRLIELRLGSVLLCSDFYTWLTKMKRLHQLKLDYPIYDENHGVSSVVCPPPRLRSLSIKLRNAAAMINLCQTAFVCAIPHLRIRFGPRFGWDNDARKSVYQDLARSCLNLSNLSLGFDVHFTHPILPDLRLLGTKPLLRLKLSGAVRAELDEPTLLCDVINLWPSLRILELPDYNADMSDLPPFLSLCPQLSYLCLKICLSKVETTLTVGPVSRGHDLELATSSEECPTDLGRLELAGIAAYLLSLRSPIVLSVSPAYTQSQLCPEWVKDLNELLRAYGDA